MTCSSDAVFLILSFFTLFLAIQHENMYYTTVDQWKKFTNVTAEQQVLFFSKVFKKSIKNALITNNKTHVWIFKGFTVLHIMWR